MVASSNDYAYTRPRRPVAASYTSPGPCYALPTLTGHAAHDPRSPHTRGPAYQFGLPFGPDPGPSSPGPCHRADPRMCRTGRDGSPSYSIYSRPKELEVFNTPGPGAYPYYRARPVTKPSAPAYTFGGVLSVREDDEKPGPNVYTMPAAIGRTVESGKQRAPVFSIYGRSKIGNFYDDIRKTPAPGAYHVITPDRYKSRAPEYSMTGKNVMPGDATMKPGPGAHFPERSDLVVAFMDFVEACLDEIALEGLDGITLSALWIRLTNRKPDFPLALDDSAKEYLWSTVIRGNENVDFYELPKPRRPLVLHDRFKNIDLETGVIVRPEDQPDDIYPVCVIKDDPDGIMGSCSDFHTRRNVTAVVRDEGMDLNSVLQRWGEAFVIVASQKLRATTLFGSRQVDPDVLTTVNDIKYAILERIGRSRYHGEVTQTPDGLKLFKIQPKSLFYIRKIIRNIGLITVQPVSIRAPQASCINGKLIHLTRFFKEFRPKYMVLLEDLTSRLAAKREQREMLSHIRSEMGLKEKTFKKLLNLGKNHVKSEVMKYKDAFPEMTENHHLKKAKSVERCVRMLQLIKLYSVNPNCDDDDDDEIEKFGREKDDESEKDLEDLDLTVAVEKEISSKVPSASTSLVCERTMLHQVLDCIDLLGGRGQSLVDLATRYGFTRLDSRTICRNLCRKDCTITVMQDVGRNRVSRYVSKRAIANAATQSAEEALREADCASTSIVENKGEEDGSAVNQTLKASQITECEAVTADEKEKEELLKFLEVFPDTTTLRTLKRAKTILTAIEQARVVSDTVLIQKKIRSEEAVASVMDRKSFVRLLDKLCAGNKLRRIVHSLPMPNGQKKELTFICAASVTDDDLLVRSALEAARQKAITVRPEPTASQKKVKEEGVSAVHSNNASAEDSPQYDVTACKRYGYLSRMARLRTLHQLLWSLVYGKRENLSPPPKNSLHADQTQTTSSVAQETTHSLLTDDLYATPETEEKSDETFSSHYTMLSWHRTLPQLPKHSGYDDDGWCFIFDVLQVIPISIICQIVSIPFVIKGLEAFLADSVTCMTPYNKLPVEWQRVISNKRRYITHFYSDCRSLALLGLLTFGKRDFKAKEQCFLYVHKRGTLVNTTRSDIPRSEFPVCPFTFETFANVEDFWLSLQSLSFNTPRENLLSFTKKRMCNADGRFDECLMEREVGNIVDSGTMPGDGMGGAGTDSTFFSHLRRNWSHNTDIDVKNESLINDGQYLIDERAKTRAMQGKVKRKRTKVESPTPEIVVQPKKKSSKAKNGDSSVKFTKDVVTGVVPKKGGKGVKRKRNNIAEGLLKKSKRVREKVVQSTEAEEAPNAAVEVARRRRKHDPKDMVAIRLLKRHRANWIPQEDSLLLLCQLTNQFLSGYNKLCLVGNGVIRDIMHENLAVSRDKTRLSCIRRIKYMMKNSVTTQNVQMYLGEAMQDKELLAEFKDGKKYTIKNSAQNEPIFKRCLAKIREKFRCENESVQDIPNTTAEVVERLSDMKSIGYGKSTHQDVNSVSEIFYSVLHNLIHSVIVLTDKIGRSRELFQLLYQYPESVVENVFKTMKNDRILTKIKKSMATKNRSGAIPLTRFGTFQISQRYMYYWHSNFVRNIFAVVGSSIRQFPPSPDDSTFGSDFLVLRNAASHSVVAVALMSLRLITFETTIPEQIVVIDSQSKEMKTVVEHQPKKKKRKLDDDESDLEEEALIEGAERDRAAEEGASTTNDGTGTSSGEVQDSMVDNVTPSVIMYNASQSSRTVLSYYRCQYVHSKSVRLINANDNICINACDVRVRLKPDVVRDVNTNCKSTWANDVDAHKTITDWNRSNIMLHPKTCQMILKSIRCIYPDRIRPIVILDLCIRRSKDRDLLTRVYEEIKRREYLGLSVYQLRETFSDVDGCDLMNNLAIMIDCKLVVRVGVTVFRYVCLEFASSWLIRIDKNLKGRGFLDIDEEDDVGIDPSDATSTTDETSSSADTSPSSSATNTCSPSRTGSQTSLLSSENESSIQFVPNPEVVGAAKKRQRSEVGDGKINAEVVEATVDDQVEEPPLKCLKWSEEAHQETRLQLRDGMEMLDCVAVTEESVMPSADSLKLREEDLEPSSNSLQSNKKDFVADADRAVAEVFERSAEHERLIGENSTMDSQMLFAASDNHALSCLESSQATVSDVSVEVEMVQRAIMADSDPTEPTLNLQTPFHSNVCSSGVSRTLSGTLPSLPTSVKFESSIGEVTQQPAAVTESKSHPCAALLETISQISRDDVVSTVESSHTSKSPARETTSVVSTSNSKSLACKGTPSANPSNLLVGEITLVASISKSPDCISTTVTSALKTIASKRTKGTTALKSTAGKISPDVNPSKSTVRKRTPIASATRRSARKSTSAFATLKPPARKSTPIIPPSSIPATTNESLVNPTSAPLPKSDTKTAEQSPSVETDETITGGSPISSGVQTDGNKRVNKNPQSTTEITDDIYFSSLINSVPKVLKRPRDFLKDRSSYSERRGGRTTPKAPKSPLPIRLPSWMSPAKETELTSVQKSPSSTATKRRRSRLISGASETPETETDQRVSKTTVASDLNPCSDDSTILPSPVLSPRASIPQLNPSQSYPANRRPRRKSSSLSSPRSDDSTVSPSPVMSPVASVVQSELPTSMTPRSKEPGTSAALTPGRKTSQVVRMATSGTCTMITVFSPEKKSVRFKMDATTAETNSETSSVCRGSNVTASPSFASPIGRYALTGSSEKPRVTTSDTMYTSDATSPPHSLPQRSTVTGGSSEMTSPMSTQHLAAHSSNRFSPAVGSPRFGSPSPGSAPSGLSSTPQGIRIRVPARTLGSASGTSDLARQIQEMLVKQGSLQPGQQVRLRLPPGMTLQNLGWVGTTSPNPGLALPNPIQPLVSSSQPSSAVVSSGQSLAGNNITVTNPTQRDRTGAGQDSSDRQAGRQSTAEDESRFRLPQVDGAGDENSLDASDVCSPDANATNYNADNSGNDVAMNCTTEDISLHLGDNASDCELLEDLCSMQPPENAEDVGESPLPERGTDGQGKAFPTPPPPKGTYKKVRLIPRPWRTPEGTVNRPTLRTMLEAVMLFVVEAPGVTRGAIVEKYNPVLQPVSIFELLEMLEEIGCLQRNFLQRSHKPALFTPRSQYRIVVEDLGKETEVFQPTSDCFVKLGQFVTQLTSGLRNASIAFEME